MYKSISVKSREDMIDYTRYATEPYVIVSISGLTTPDPLFYENENERAVLYLHFRDTDYEPDCISKQQAKEIADFVKQYENSDVDLFFHCRAGVSRSAGCAAAAMLYEYGDDSFIFNSFRYRPNMKCYTRVLEAFDMSYAHIIKAKENYLNNRLT